MSKNLIKGVAYHGNRMLTHIREDMQDIVASGLLQTHYNPIGREEEIITAADAICDNGARTVFA